MAHADHFIDLQLTELLISPSLLLANDFDPDGDALTVVIVSGPAHGTLIQNTNGSWTYMPTSAYSGTDAFRDIVTAGRFCSAPVVATIEVQQTIGGITSGGGNGGGSGSSGGSGYSSTTRSVSSGGGSTGSGSGGT